ncbi:hypothetical protein [Bradyrhizobium sp. SUTN9-2]|uniref:hypothetical protein n=1 Tax=Bradyrhizobium TaxID=374 RepID=UPI0011B1C922|nr:hypothetical protein [Bradyrhizobium sp. SUTN9-2]
MNSLWMGITMFAIAAVLIIIGRPNKAGEHPWFLRFEASLVLYPPIVLIFIALGSVALISSLLNK